MIPFCEKCDRLSKYEIWCEDCPRHVCRRCADRIETFTQHHGSGTITLYLCDGCQKKRQQTRQPQSPSLQEQHSEPQASEAHPLPPKKQWLRSAHSPSQMVS